MRFSPVLICIAFAFPAIAQDAGRGAVLFADHCATCHGAKATGNGPMRAVLSVPPPDLTRLAQGNGGVFPTAQLVRRIDGRTEVLAHGGPMPLFGMLLDGPSGAILAPDGSEVVTTEAIVDIAAWLERIQIGG
jgi:mono/diheme cytochrome c family protein